jgi:4-methylaminobutanoate oxidase (formaldehyde-forming)
MTAMSKYGIELYATLEARPAGHRLEAVRQRQRREHAERMKVLRKQLALARSFRRRMPRDFAGRSGRAVPVLRTDDLQGALWLPGDGKANPADLCMSLAKARASAA